MLEAVNYLEHYGLARQRVPSGRYERPAPVHSWNSDHLVTNIFLYHLQRHSDHHTFPTRRYQALRNWAEAPELPAGYAGMIVLAYIPPLWRRVMVSRWPICTAGCCRVDRQVCVGSYSSESLLVRLMKPHAPWFPSWMVKKRVVRAHLIE